MSLLAAWKAYAIALPSSAPRNEARCCKKLVTMHAFTSPSEADSLRGKMVASYTYFGLTCCINICIGTGTGWGGGGRGGGDWGDHAGLPNILCLRLHYSYTQHRSLFIMFPPPSPILVVPMPGQKGVVLKAVHGDQLINYSLVFIGKFCFTDNGGLVYISYKKINIKRCGDGMPKRMQTRQG